MIRDVGMRALCRLRLKKVADVEMEDLAEYLAKTPGQNYPARVLQALEIILNAPFLMDDKFLYQSRGLYELSQAQVSAAGACAPAAYTA